jgi:hypothetical protein
MNKPNSLYEAIIELVRMDAYKCIRASTDIQMQFPDIELFKEAEELFRSAFDLFEKGMEEAIRVDV